MNNVYRSLSNTGTGVPKLTASIVSTITCSGFENGKGFELWKTILWTHLHNLIIESMEILWCVCYANLSQKSDCKKRKCQWMTCCTMIYDHKLEMECLRIKSYYQLCNMSQGGWHSRLTWEGFASRLRWLTDWKDRGKRVVYRDGDERQVQTPLNWICWWLDVTRERLLLRDFVSAAEPGHRDVSWHKFSKTLF